MRNSPSSPRMVQLKLFHPPAQGPSWEKFPHAIRQQTVGLLVRLLREHCARVLASKPGKEAWDE